MRHFIEGTFAANPETAFGELAASSLVMGRHTTVVFLHREQPSDSTMVAVEIVWVSKERPAGVNVPAQCTQCGCIDCFVVKEASNHLSWAARCARCQNILPQYNWQADSQVVNTSMVGNWHLMRRSG